MLQFSLSYCRNKCCNSLKLLLLLQCLGAAVCGVCIHRLRHAWLLWFNVTVSCAWFLGLKIYNATYFCLLQFTALLIKWYGCFSVVLYLWVVLNLWLVGLNLMSLRCWTNFILNFLIVCNQILACIFYVFGPNYRLNFCTGLWPGFRLNVCTCL